MNGKITNLLNSDTYAKLMLYLVPAVLAAVLIYVIIKVVKRIEKSSIGKLVYRRAFEEDGVFESDSVYLTETIYNPTIFPLLFVRAEAYLYPSLKAEGINPAHGDGMIPVRSKFRLLPFMQIKRRHKIKCTARGYYKLENVVIKIGNTERNIDAVTEIYVYPQILPINDMDRSSSIVQGNAPSRKNLTEDPFSLCGIREYRPNDPFSIINFKATAKSGIVGTGGIRVNARDYSSSRTVMIYMNFDVDTDNISSSKEYGAMTEYGLSYSASLLQNAIDEGYMAGFAANCMTSEGDMYIFFPPESGETQFHEILKAMAKIRSAPGISASALMDQGNAVNMNNADIFFITDHTDKETASRLDVFFRHGNNVVVIGLDKGEKDAFPNK